MAWSSLGPTHHTTEDISVLRAIPNLMILSPATPRQVTACVQAAYEHNGPVYIRIGMNHEAEYFSEDYTYHAGQNDLIRDGRDLAVFVTGSILDEVVQACDLLEQDGISVKLTNIVDIKPFNTQDIIEAARTIGKIVVVEEHNIYGGLGSIIAETVAYNGLHARVYPIGLNDAFAEGYGTQQMVRKANALDAVSVYRRLKEAVML